MEYASKKRLVRIIFSGALILILIALITLFRTFNRSQIQFNILFDKEIIHLSTYAEPPQFAIWLENKDNKDVQTVFVTHRISSGDWEGKPDVPVALPRWSELFTAPASLRKVGSKDDVLAVTGATPKDDYFSVRVEVKPGTEWICWIEMNLAGDYNDSFPEFDRETFSEDEFSCGQPALIYRSEIIAREGNEVVPLLFAQSIWENGNIRTEPVSEGVTTARFVFKDVSIQVIRPKPRIINRYKEISQ